MIDIIPCTGPQDIDQIKQRQGEDTTRAEGVVADILDNVRRRGDEALREYTLRFDGAHLDTLEVQAEELAAATAAADPAFLAILQEAAANIHAYHSRQTRNGYMLEPRQGVVLGQRILPLDRVGVYVPGGTASYASTVLMDVIPAKIAGVGEIIMTTPCGKDGKINPDILAAAQIAGVSRIFRLGGAQAIAALAYGTESVPRVDKIVGPGNLYVATAKRMVFGQVDIDMIAGPSEILIIADDTANPAHVAMDMLSQAEHDKNAAAYLVTTSQTLADAVAHRLEDMLPQLPRQEIARAAIDNNSAILLAPTLEKAVEISNALAPEHLEVCTADPFALLPLIRHAGSIFLGNYAPEALGDYFAGPNHTLPTGGTARFSSPLGVDDFIKRSSFMYYNRSALQRDYRKIAAFARREGLEAHARSAEIRFEGEDA